MNNDYRDYLQHHGIPGMKWGVRRYQNEDGSLTDKGKKRYARQTTNELNRMDQERAVTAFHASNQKDLARFNKYRLDKLASKKAKAESLRKDSSLSERKRAKQGKKIDKISKKQARVQEAMNRHLSEYDQHTKKMRELEKTIDKTINKLSKKEYSINSIKMNRLVASTGYVDYYMPGTVYSVRVNKNKS